ncbi:MAG: LCP family protein [Candidatus Saccharibacteria bacterium]|nr:LCP family protein [Candidatus Saccharibacteria bacterium]
MPTKKPQQHVSKSNSVENVGNLDDFSSSTIQTSPTETSITKSAFDLNLEEENKVKRRWLFFKKKSSKNQKSSRKKRILKRTGLVFAVIILAVGSILGYGYMKYSQIFKGNGDGAAALQENVDPSKLNGEGDGRVNILLLGKGGPGHEAPDLTDTILLASIDPVQDEAALLSIPRDLYVEDALGTSMKINAVYSTAKQSKLAKSGKTDADLQAAEDAGLKAVKQTVSEVLGVPVHYYVMVDFTAFKEAIDTVGGITIDVKEPLYDASMAWLNGGKSLLADEGLQTFDGTRALMYARSRHGSARGDFDRTERQREVILALQQKAMSMGTFSNPFKVVELLNTLGNNVRTDLNGTGELKRLYEIIQKIGGDKFISVGLADPPNILVTTNMVNGLSIVEPVAGLYQYEDIQSYVRNTLRDAFLRQEDARVVILNGTTTPGLATATEKELKSYGYNVVKVDNAPTSDFIESKLIEITTDKPYTSSYLEKRLGLTKSSSMIEGLPTAETADFVIILGTDEVTKTTTN